MFVPCIFYGLHLHISSTYQCALPKLSPTQQKPKNRIMKFVGHTFNHSGFIRIGCISNHLKHVLYFSGLYHLMWNGQYELLDFIKFVYQPLK